MRLNYVTQRIKQLLPKIGGELILEPQYQYAGCIVFDNGKRSFFKDSSFDVNPQGAVKIAIDKGYTNYFLQRFGFNVPVFDTFASENLNLKQTKGIQEGYEFALKIGFPVILKPNIGTNGNHVYKVNDRIEYFKNARKILTNSDVMMVQAFATGNDFRIGVFDGKVYCAYQRVPLFLIGNGEDTIFALLKSKEASIKKSKSINSFNWKDERIQTSLKMRNLSFDTVLAQGEKISLLQIANLSLGGQPIDYTNRISKEYQKLAVDIVQKMGLRFCGIDLMTHSIEGNIGDYSLIELNSAPGLSNFATLGINQEKIVDDLYFDMLNFLKNRRY